MSKTTKQTEVESIAPVQVDFDPIHLASLSSTSARIRYLDSKGLKRGQIAKTLNKRYQHVRNVLITPLKKQG